MISIPILQVKSFYEAEIKNIKGRVTQIPEYPRWFVPCVKKWLQHFQRKAVDFVDNAWEDDKLTFGVREQLEIITSATKLLCLSLSPFLSLHLMRSRSLPPPHFRHFSFSIK